MEPAASEPPAEVSPEPTGEEAPVTVADTAVDETVKPAPEEPSNQEVAPAKAKKGKKVQLKLTPKQNAKKADNTEKTEKSKEKAKATAKTKKGAKADKKKTAKGAITADAPPPVEEVQSKTEPENPQAEATPADVPKPESDTAEANQTPAVTETAEAMPESSGAEPPSADTSSSTTMQEPTEGTLPHDEQVVQSETPPQSNTEKDLKPDNEEAAQSELPAESATGNEADKGDEAGKQVDVLPQPSSENEAAKVNEEVTQSELPLQPTTVDEINTNNETGTQPEAPEKAAPENETAAGVDNDVVVIQAVVAQDKPAEAEVEAKAEQVNEETSQSGPTTEEIKAESEPNKEAQTSEDAGQEPEQTSTSDDTGKSVTITEEPVAALEQETEKELPPENEPGVDQKLEVVAEKLPDETKPAETEQAIDVKQDLIDKPSQPNTTDIAQPAPVDPPKSDGATAAEASEEANSTTEAVDTSSDGVTTIDIVALPSAEIDVASADQQTPSESDSRAIPAEPAQGATEVEEQETSSTAIEQKQTESSPSDPNVQETIAEPSSDTKVAVDPGPTQEASSETSPEITQEIHEEANPENNVEPHLETVASTSLGLEPDNNVVSVATDSVPEESSANLTNGAESKDDPILASLNEAKSSLSVIEDLQESTTASDTTITIPETAKNEDGLQIKIDELANADNQGTEKEPTTDVQPEPTLDLPVEVDTNAAPLKVEDPTELVSVPEVLNDHEEKKTFNEETPEKVVELHKHDQTDSSPELAIPQTAASASDSKHADVEGTEAPIEQPENLAEESGQAAVADKGSHSTKEINEPVTAVVTENTDPPETSHITNPDDVDNRSIAAVCDDQTVEREQEAADQDKTVQEDSARESPVEKQEQEGVVVDTPKNEPEAAKSVVADENPNDTEPPKSDQEVTALETTEALETSNSKGLDATADLPSLDAIPEIIPVSLSNDKERDKKRHRRRSTTEHHSRHQEKPHSESKSKDNEDTHGHSSKSRTTHSQRAADSHFRRHKAADVGSEAQPQLISRRDHHDTGNAKASKSQNHQSRPEMERKSSIRPSPTSDEPQRPRLERAEGSHRSMKSAQRHEKDSPPTNNFGLNALGRALRPKLFTGSKAQSEVYRSSRDSNKHEAQDLLGQSPSTTRSPRSPVEPKMQRSYSEYKPTPSEEEAAHRLAHSRRREREAKDAANADAARRSARREAHKLEHDTDQKRTEAGTSNRTRRKHAERRDSEGTTTHIAATEDETIGDSNKIQADPESPQIEDKPDHNHRNHYRRTSSHGNANSSNSVEKNERPQPHRSHRRHSYVDDHPRKAKGEGNPKDQTKKNESAAAPVGLLKRIFGN